MSSVRTVEVGDDVGLTPTALLPPYDNNSTVQPVNSLATAVAAVGLGSDVDGVLTLAATDIDNIPPSNALPH